MRSIPEMPGVFFMKSTENQQKTGRKSTKQRDLSPFFFLTIPGNTGIMKWKQNTKQKKQKFIKVKKGRRVIYAL